MAKRNSQIQLLDVPALAKLDRDQIDDIKHDIVTKIKDGIIPVGKFFASITVFNEIINGRGSGKYKQPGVKEQVYDEMLSIISRRGPLDVGNFRITEKESGVKYDYTHDPVWNELNEKLNAAKEALSLREKRLKSAPMPDSLKGIKAETEVDNDTGEVFEVLPPSKTSTTVPNVTYIKPKK